MAPGPRFWHALPDWRMNGAIFGITPTTCTGLGLTELTVGNDVGGELPSAPARNNWAAQIASDPPGTGRHKAVCRQCRR